MIFINKRNEHELSWTADFGVNLQRMLHRKEMSQGQLAKELNTTETMISRYIHGTSVPSVYRVYRIAKIIDCDISDLVKTKFDI